MSEVLCRLIGLGNDIGTVTSAMMYDSGYLAVDGVTNDGKKFNLNLTVREETEDGN